MDRRTLLRMVPVVAGGLLLAGCTEQGAQGTTAEPGYVSSQGIDEFSTPTRTVTFSGTSATGQKISSKQYLGKVVVVNFWFAQCPPCIAEAPTLNSLATTYADQVQFVGVNVSDNSATVKSFETLHRTPYPSIVDQEGGVSVQLAFAAVKPPKAVPATFVLDREGRVVARMVGLANKSNLNQLIEDAVNRTVK
jgi:thiol-disulfide isomerase/thioredoxin